MIKSIQLLRAIAAIAVVFFHCNFLNIKTGMFGIDIFFIISGFIIAYMVNQTTELFIIKRIIRVSPLYFIATFLTIAIAFIKPEWFTHVVINTESLIKSFFYIPYQVNESGPIVSSGWVLNNEMFFYMLMFICILIFRKKHYLVPACAALLIGFIILLHIFSENSITEYSFILQFYRNGLLPEFIYGLGLYYFWSYYVDNRKKSVNILMITLGLSSFAFMIFCDLNQSFLSIPRNILYGIPALLFVNAFLVLENKINEKNRIIKIGLKLGDASYAMYLFHTFLVYFLLSVIYPYTLGKTDIFIVEFLKMILAIAIVCGASVLIHIYVDKPLNYFFKKRIQRYNEMRVTKWVTT